MKEQELNRNCIETLKQSYYCDRNESVSYDELANIDSLVSDDELFDYYSGVEFTEDDF